jgi:hypothetical protein
MLCGILDSTRLPLRILGGIPGPLVVISHRASSQDVEFA